jgi:hypothetical protein
MWICMHMYMHMYIHKPTVNAMASTVDNVPCTYEYAHTCMYVHKPTVSAMASTVDNVPEMTPMKVEYHRPNCIHVCIRIHVCICMHVCLYVHVYCERYHRGKLSTIVPIVYMYVYEHMYVYVMYACIYDAHMFVCNFYCERYHRGQLSTIVSAACGCMNANILATYMHIFMHVGQCM